MKYEFMAIIKPFLPEDGRIKLIDQIKKSFTERGGKILDEDLWGKRHLAYKIDGHEEGYYVLYNVELPQDEVKELEEEMRLKGDILRYIIIKEDN